MYYQYIIASLSLTQSILIYAFISFIIYRFKRNIDSKIKEVTRRNEELARKNKELESLPISERGEAILLGGIILWIVLLIPIIRLLFLFFNWLDMLI